MMMKAFHDTIIHLGPFTMTRIQGKRSAFPGFQAQLKALFEATKKWTMPIRNWEKVRGELAIMYTDRLPD